MTTLVVDDVEFDDDAVTLERKPPRAARGSTSPLAASIGELRARAAAYRAQARAFNAKLSIVRAGMRERERGELHALREHLARIGARLEHAVDDIDAAATLESLLLSPMPKP